MIAGLMNAHRQLDVRWAVIVHGDELCAWVMLLVGRLRP